MEKSPGGQGWLIASSRSAQYALAVVAALAVLVVGGQALLKGNLAPRAPAVLDQRIDVNQASTTELALLPGVGPVLADRIVDYRRQHGPFLAIEDLSAVPGIGTTTLSRLRPHVLIQSKPGDKRSVSPGSPAASPPVRLSLYPPTPSPAVLNPNTASLAELDTLPGIGPKLAQRIVDARTKNAFTRPEDLRRVKGIGPKTLAKIKPYLVFTQ